MVTESPPVSPSVVAAILIIQKTKVTSGTLLADGVTVILASCPGAASGQRTIVFAPVREKGNVVILHAVTRGTDRVVLVGGFRILRAAARCSAGSDPGAAAGPPYLSDDPEPTDYRHFEIYTFNNGTVTRSDTSGEAGLDINYGGAPNLQLTATIPADLRRLGRRSADGRPGQYRACRAKYRFLTQQNFGLETLAGLPAPVLAERGGQWPRRPARLRSCCRSGWRKIGADGRPSAAAAASSIAAATSQDFCLAGVVVTRQIASNLQIGLELFHQSADTRAAAQP